MIIWVFWRKHYDKCLRCSKQICSCSSWCRCSMNELQDFYKHKYWDTYQQTEKINKDIAIAQWFDKRTLWDIFSDIKNIEKRWPFIWSFIHLIPYIVWNDFKKEDMLVLFRSLQSLLCQECKDHAEDFIKKHSDIIKDWDNKSLLIFINDFHNNVNKRHNKKQFTVEESIIYTWKELLKNKVIKHIDLYKPTWWYNV